MKHVRKIAGVLVMLLGTAACDPSQDPDVGAMCLAAEESRADNRELVQGFYDDIFNDHRLDRASDYVAEDYVQHNPMVGQGLDGFVEFFGYFFGVAPDTHAEVFDIVVDGDRAVVYYRLQGTLDGEFAGAQIAAKPFAFDAVDVFRIQDGKFVEHWDVLDSLTFLTQLGILPAPGG